MSHNSKAARIAARDPLWLKAVLILATMPVARSAGGRSIVLNEPPTRSAAPDTDHVPDKHRAPGVMWKGDHDRTRRVAGVRSRASITAARWSHAQSVETETVVVNAV